MAVSLVFVAFSTGSAAAVSFPTSSLSIGGRPFTVEIATSTEQLMQGLMHRTNLPADHGMLFVFPQPQHVSMWMKDTPISLDMLFIDAQGKIVHIAADTVPESEALIASPHPVKAVLELPAATCKKRNINIGDQVRHAVFAH